MPTNPDQTQIDVLARSLKASYPGHDQAPTGDWSTAEITLGPERMFHLILLTEVFTQDPKNWRALALVSLKLANGDSLPADQKEFLEEWMGKKQAGQFMSGITSAIRPAEEPAEELDKDLEVTIHPQEPEEETVPASDPAEQPGFSEPVPSEPAVQPSTSTEPVGTAVMSEEETGMEVVDDEYPDWLKGLADVPNRTKLVSDPKLVKPLEFVADEDLLSAESEVPTINIKIEKPLIPQLAEALKTNSKFQVSLSEIGTGQVFLNLVPEEIDTESRIGKVKVNQVEIDYLTITGDGPVKAGMTIDLSKAVVKLKVYLRFIFENAPAGNLALFDLDVSGKLMGQEELVKARIRQEFQNPAIALRDGFNEKLKKAKAKVFLKKVELKLENGKLVVVFERKD